GGIPHPLGQEEFALPLASRADGPGAGRAHPLPPRPGPSANAPANKQHPAPYLRVAKKWVVLGRLGSSEQQYIVAHLNYESARIDALITKTQQSLDLLKERRAALITAAVTGQIDLREAATS
ncbi:MAG: hypothetical protein PHH26_08980, partial [Candidatus Thermoplasmatota archaeon]|nr:hypothetical protein [Candidatus Thermoplasmatota archaeon]